MATRMGKRAVIVGHNQPIEIWEREFSPPERGEVLLRVQMGGVCGTDVHLWNGDVTLPLPVVLGHEGIGTVEELGGRRDNRSGRFTHSTRRSHLLGTGYAVPPLLLLHGDQRFFAV